MNESYERALNQVSLLKKTLNSQKTSHQNTLQQLQTAYQIIDDMKQMLKNQQQKNKALLRQVKDKNSKIEEISRQYQEHIVNIKELIQRKDLQIRKYTQVKVTDYDMIRFRVISQVEAQHHQEIQLHKKQIQKQQFLYNQSLFEIKVLRDKNTELSKEIQQLKEQSKFIEEQLTNRHSAQINKVFGLLQQQKLKKKQAQKRMQQQKQKHSQTIKKYHQQLEALQSQLINRSGKQNNHRHSNLNANSSSLIQVKESQFAQQNEKLKRQLKIKTEELDQLQRKHKSQIRQHHKKVDQVEKELTQANFQIKQLQIQIKQSKSSVQQQALSKCKRQFEKKEISLKQNFTYDLETKEKEIKKLKKQIDDLKYSQSKDNLSKGTKPNEEREDLFRLQRQNDQLQAQLKKTKLELNQYESKKKDEFQNRQTRAISVQNVKEKLDTANLQIVTLLKDKIALNQKLSRMSQNK